MPALSKSTIFQLTGQNANIIASDLIFGTSFNSDVIFLQDSGRSVQTTASANIVTFTGGDATPFIVGNFVSFTSDSNAYQITAVGTNTITLSGSPTEKAGDTINTSIDLTGATFALSVTEYTSSGVTQDTRSGLDLGIVAQKMPIVTINLSAFIYTINLVQGWLQINVPAATFTDIPTPGDGTGTMPVIYAGSLSVTRPNQGAAAATFVDKQRVVWIIWSALG